jgi:hypothetical protein
VDLDAGAPRVGKPDVGEPLVGKSEVEVFRRKAKSPASHD